MFLLKQLFNFLKVKEKTIYRRQFLEKAVRVGVLASGILLSQSLGGIVQADDTPAIPIDESMDDLSDLFREAAFKKGGVDVLGKRITGVCIQSPDRSHSSSVTMYWQFGGLQYHPKEEFSLVPMLQRFHEKGLDAQLGNGSLGVIIPPTSRIKENPNLSREELFQQRVTQFNYPPRIIDYISELKYHGVDPGLPTSPKYVIDGVETYRFEGMAFQIRPDSEFINHLFVGDLAKKAGLIPKEVWLKEPTNDSEVNLNEYSYVPVEVRKSIREGEMSRLVDWAAGHMGISSWYAKSIVQCESEFDPAAVNRSSGARGLWQEMVDAANVARYEARGWNMYTDWVDPIKNTIIAIDIMKAQGVRAWSCA